MKKEDDRLDQNQLDRNTTSVELLKQDMSYLKEGVGEIKEGMRIGLRDIKTEVTNLNDTITDKYATKEELKVVTDDLQVMKNLKEWAVKIILGAIIVSLLAAVGFKTR